MESQRRKYFEILTNGVDTLLKSSNNELWTRVHSVFDLSMKTFNELAHKTQFKFESQEHREHVLVSLTFVITNLVFTKQTQTQTQKRLEGGTRFQLQRQGPRTHKVHHRQNRPHAKEFKEKNRRWLVNQWEKTQAEKKLALFLAQPWESVSERTVSDMTHGDKPNWGFCAIHIFLLLLKPLEFHQNRHLQSSRRLAEAKTSSSLIVRDPVKVEQAIQLSHPAAAAAEFISILKESGTVPTQTRSGAKCFTVTAVPLTGSSKFSVKDVEILDNLLLASFFNYSIGEFGGLVIQEPNNGLRLHFDMRKGNRSSTTVPSLTVLYKTVAQLHIHPLQIDRVHSPPSLPDIENHIDRVVTRGIPYDYIATPTGHFIISLQDNSLEQLRIMHARYFKAKESYEKAKEDLAVAFAKAEPLMQQATLGAHVDPVAFKTAFKNVESQQAAHDSAVQLFEPIDADMNLFMRALTNTRVLNQIQSELAASMDECTYLPSGLLSSGQNMIDVDIQTNTFGTIKMTTGISIHFVNKTDLLQGRMIQLPWIKKFSIVPSVSGVTGTNLTDSLVTTYDMGFSDSMRILRNQTIPHTPANLIANAWGQLSPGQQKEFLISLEGNYTLARFMMLVKKGESSRPMLRELVHENLLSRPENVAESMKAHLSKKSGGGKSILDKPGMITKMVFGDGVKETMFMNLPYPLNLLKKYI